MMSDEDSRKEIQIADDQARGYACIALDSYVSFDMGEFNRALYGYIRCSTRADTLREVIQ